MLYCNMNETIKISCWNAEDFYAFSNRNVNFTPLHN